MNGYQLLWSLLRHVMLGRGRAPVFIVPSPNDNDVLQDAMAHDSWVIEEIYFEADGSNFLVATTVEGDQ